MIFRIPVALHKAYHDLFGNLTPLEVIDLLFKVFLRPGRFKKYRRVVNGGEPPPKVDPDKLVLALTKLIEGAFPNWIPPEALIRNLTERRRRLT